MSGPALPLTRRAALLTGSGSLAAVVTGCQVGPPGTGTTSPSGPTSAATGTDATSDADQELVRRALQDETRMRRGALRAARRHGALRPTLRRTADVHAAHVALLERSLRVADPGPVAAAAPRDLRAAARLLARDERVLAEAHTRAALDARSGPLARVLAGMAAAAAQQAHVLDALAAPGPRRG